jgi:hypothetical protein
LALRQQQFWQISQKYLPAYAEICFQDGKTDADFILKTFLNRSRESNEQVIPTHIRTTLPSILDERALMALTITTMPQLEEVKTENFVVCLKHKLCL